MLIRSPYPIEFHVRKTRRKLSQTRRNQRRRLVYEARQRTRALYRKMMAEGLHKLFLHYLDGAVKE